MDVVQLAAALIIFAFAFYALERLPLPKQPPWLRQVLEVLLAIVAIGFLLQRVFGVALLQA